MLRFGGQGMVLAWLREDNSPITRQNSSELAYDSGGIWDVMKRIHTNNSIYLLALDVEMFSVEIDVAYPAFQFWVS